MEPDASGIIVRKIMAEFADRTGLSLAEKPPRRYLWTDAFAVCNFLGLFRQARDEQYLDLALRLVDQVHHTLGRHREDDPRTGWISGLDEKEGRRHPTTGGLRIGKSLNERKPGEPFDERLEWDRDGQYFHYLTKWMHALNRLSRVTGDPTCNRWAMELAETAHARFSYLPSLGRRKRMRWKMSIDLSRPLVPAMGQHDPLDGLLTYSELQATAIIDFEKSPAPDLSTEIADMADICRGQNWGTDDPLGIGGLLADAARTVRLMSRGTFGQTGLLETVLDSSRLGLESFSRSNLLNLPAEYRLAFRELGLSIGLKAIEKLRGWIEENQSLFNEKDSLLPRVEALMQYVPLSEVIEMFWMDAQNREASSWTEHQDINMVMLATSLAPEGFLAI